MDGTHTRDMNTTQPFTASRFSTDLRWVGTDGLTRGAQSGANFGVQNTEGRWLSFGADGSPSVWGRKSVAAEIAATIEPSAELRWVVAVKA